MDSQLKTLKVADLKQILAQAHLDTTGKKADLIARILASTEAQAVYNARNSSAPPAEPPAAQPQPLSSPPSQSPQQKQQKQNPPSVTQSAVAVPTPTPPAPTSAPLVEDEAEKRRKRAERFGIPVVDPKAVASPKKSTKAVVSASPDDAEKLKARSAKFGTTQQAASHKRVATYDDVDAEELERRKKRAERFGAK